MSKYVKGNMDGCTALVHEHTNKPSGWGLVWGAKAFLTKWHNFDIFNRPELEFNFHTVCFVVLEEKLIKLVGHNGQAKLYKFEFKSKPLQQFSTSGNCF